LYKVECKNAYFIRIRDFFAIRFEYVSNYIYRKNGKQNQFYKAITQMFNSICYIVIYKRFLYKIKKLNIKKLSAIDKCDVFFNNLKIIKVALNSIKRKIIRVSLKSEKHCYIFLVLLKHFTGTLCHYIESNFPRHFIALRASFMHLNRNLPLHHLIKAKIAR